MRSVTILAALAGMLAGCAPKPAPVDRPCGVITDSLRDVIGQTPAMTKRIDAHFEAGVAAGCWDRAAKADVLADLAERAP